MRIYPDRELVETYLEHQSVWEEVWAGETNLYDALQYMRLDEGSALYEQVRVHLIQNRTPL